MTTRPIDATLPPHLRDLSARSQDLPEALRAALQATLADASPNASPQHVLADTFARLGYLPEEATQASEKLLAQPR